MPIVRLHGNAVPVLFTSDAARNRAELLSRDVDAAEDGDARPGSIEAIWACWRRAVGQLASSTTPKRRSHEWLPLTGKSPPAEGSDCQVRAAQQALGQAMTAGKCKAARRCCHPTGRSRPKPARQPSPKLPDARTDLFRVWRLREAAVRGPRGAGQEPSVGIPP